MLEALVRQKKNHPHLKVIACGGWAGSEWFFRNGQISRKQGKICKSVVKFIRKYKLDGLDIDWEYPVLPGMGNLICRRQGELYCFNV